MANRTGTQKAARALQTLTDWSYSECFNLSRTQTTEGIVAIALKRGETLDATSEAYAHWIKRAQNTTGVFKASDRAVAKDSHEKV
jgi:hypothetical protein